MPPLRAVREPAAAPRPTVPGAEASSSRRRPPPATETRIVEDLLDLVARAERVGLRAERAGRWRWWLRSRPYALRELAVWEQRLRAWVNRQPRPRRERGMSGAGP